MKLEKHLILNKYFLRLLGLKEFNELRTRLKDIDGSYDFLGRSSYIDVLIQLKPEWEEQLLEYDEAIKQYVEKLRINRKQPDFNLKYFQYLAVLFSEIFFDKYFNTQQQFLNELNDFLVNFNEFDETEIGGFSGDDIRKLAFWMATGSGKTLIMHINYWQILKYAQNSWDNILLITPNEGLSKQHYEELKLSGIPAKLYSGSIDNLKTISGEILILDIHKLTKEKRGQGVSVDISYFDGQNLVFIDEGHKGQKSEEQKWKKLREEIGRKGFLLEYSATFGQIIGKNKDLLSEYAKAIIFDYSYKYFYTDGYGKDFYVHNLEAKGRGYSEDSQDLLLTAGLLSLYEQLMIFEANREALKEYNLEQPLWIFVGSTVIKKKSSHFTLEERKIASDVERVLKFLNSVLENASYLKENINKILKGRSGLKDQDGNDLFQHHFKYLKTLDVDMVVENIYQNVFRGKGRLELHEIKNAEGEIGLKTTTAETYFGVVNVGDVFSLKKLIKEGNIELKVDYFSPSLFSGINESHSSINILIGSKKFIEGWNSWRVSNMGLINMGKGEGAQIIQLFGRGVRLKGKNYSLKREPEAGYHLNVLQTLFIFGLNADYIHSFLRTLEKEDFNYMEFIRPARLVYSENGDQREKTIQQKIQFNVSPIKLTLNEDLLQSITLDLRPKLSLAHGLKTETVTARVEASVDIPEEYFDLIDWDLIFSEIMDFKIVKGMHRLIIDREVLKKIIRSKQYRIFLNDTEGLFTWQKNGRPVLKLNSFEGLKKFHELIVLILRAYISKFYRNKPEGEHQMR